MERKVKPFMGSVALALRYNEVFEENGFNPFILVL